MRNLGCLAVVFVLSIFTFGGAAAAKTNFQIVTWNVEHLMSEPQFIEWAKFCEPHAWVDPDPKVVGKSKARPVDYNFCNALDGKDYETKKQTSKAVHDEVAYWEKVNALKEMVNNLRADIVAIQEIRDKEAALVLFPEDIWIVHASNYKDISQNVAFALRKETFEKKGFSIDEVEVIDDLSIKDDDGYGTRPGLSLSVTMNNLAIKLLNVHMKASCSIYTLGMPETPVKDNPIKKARRERGCAILSQQVPILEGWIEKNANNNFAILGDFNRRFSKDIELKPVRRDGTNPQEPLKDLTNLGSIFYEISDGEPDGASLERISSIDSANAGECFFGFDHFLIGDQLAKALSIDDKFTFSIREGYPAKHYAGINAVIPSDHCPVRMVLKIPTKDDSKTQAPLALAAEIKISNFRDRPFFETLTSHSGEIIADFSDERVCQSGATSEGVLCAITNEANRPVKLTSELTESLKFLYNYFNDKVVNNAEPYTFKSYFQTLHAMEDADGFTTKDLDSLDLTGFIKSPSRYIRPQVIMMSNGGGVTVEIDENNFVYNISYQFGKGKPGRSYAGGSYRAADDVSYPDYFDRLGTLLRTESEENILLFYEVVLDILLQNNADKLATMSNASQSLVTDFMAIYIAEAFRHETGGSTAFHEDLLTVTILSAWSVKAGLVINKNGLIPWGRDRLEGFISRSKGGSGLGGARNNRIEAQKSICATLKSLDVDGELEKLFELVGDVSKDDCLYQIAQMLNRLDYQEVISDKAESIVRGILVLVKSLRTNTDDIKDEVF